MHVIRRDPRIMRACFHPTTDDLDGRVARGAAWMGTLVVVRTVLTLGATAILARLLTPSDYGYVAMATVVTELGAMLCVFGLPAIIVRAPHLTRLDLDSAPGKVSLRDYMRSEARFRAVEALDPPRYERLVALAERDVERRIELYKQLSLIKLSAPAE